MKGKLGSDIMTSLAVRSFDRIEVSSNFWRIIDSNLWSSVTKYSSMFFWWFRCWKNSSCIFKFHFRNYKGVNFCFFQNNAGSIYIPLNVWECLCNYPTEYYKPHKKSWRIDIWAQNIFLVSMNRQSQSCSASEGGKSQIFSFLYNKKKSERLDAG